MTDPKLRETALLVEPGKIVWRKRRPTPARCELRQHNDAALRSFVERVWRDEADELDAAAWDAWVNALPFEEFIEWIAHDWKAEPMPELSARLGIPADGQRPEPQE